MSQPTPNDVHVDSVLTNVSVAYLQDSTSYVADKVFPVVPVEHKSDKYYKYTKGDFFRDVSQARAAGTESAGGGYSLATDSFSCEVYAFHKDVDEQTLANADLALGPEIDATRFITQVLMIGRERAWASAYFGTGIWGTDKVGTTDFTKWSSDVSDPIHDIGTARITILQNTGFLPNKLVLGAKVFESLKRHPLIVDRIKYTGAASANELKVPTEAAMAELFEVEEVLVSRAVYNSANEGATDNFSFISGDNALLTYASPMPGLMQPSGGYTFVWARFTGLNTHGLRVKTFPLYQLSSSRVEGEMAYCHKLVSSELGYFFSGAI
ncbi:MAG: hypothetical protein ABT940_09115 [Alphaproteobacteria bacterium]